MVYQVLRSQLFYLDSADRSPESNIGSPVFSFPNNLLRIDATQKIRVCFNEATIPYTFFQTEEFNNKFGVGESVIRGGVVVESLKVISLDTGNYSIDTLINELIQKLNSESNLYRYQLTYDDSRNEIIYVAIPILATDIVDDVRFIFNRPFILENLQIDIGESAFELLGFPFGSVIVFVQPDSGINQLTTKSSIPTNMSSAVDNLYIRIENNCNNFTSDGVNRYSYSNTLAKIPIAQPPFSTIFFYNIDDNYSTVISGNTLDNFNIKLENKRGTLIVPRSDWSLTIRVEVIIDKNEIGMEASLNEMVKILKMNFIKENDRQKPKTEINDKIEDKNNINRIYNSE
jgi:hypothetical protein